MIEGIAKRLINMFFPLHVMYRMPTSGAKVVLSFDDGPHPEHTPIILQALARNEAKATFFVLGSQAEKYPELIIQIKEQGHEVANHGYFHSHALETGTVEETNNTLKAQNLIERAGIDRKHYRPPYGEVTLQGLLHLLLKGYSFIFWSWDSEDSNEQNPQAFHQQLSEMNIRAGDILLFHEDYSHTAESMDGFIQKLKTEKNIECVSLESLL